MRHEQIPASQAWAKAAEFPFVWALRESEATLGKTNGLLESDELTEARCFGPQGELHILRGADGAWQAYFHCEEAEDTVLDSVSKLIPPFGGTLTVRKIIGFDEDGQAYIAAVRMLDWKEGRA